MPLSRPRRRDRRCAESTWCVFDGGEPACVGQETGATTRTKVDCVPLNSIVGDTLMLRGPIEQPVAYLERNLGVEVR